MILKTWHAIGISKLVRFPQCGIIFNQPYIGELMNTENTITRFSDIAARILSDAQRVETMGATVSGKLLALYKECNDAEAFDNACAVAETDWKAKRAKAKQDTRLPSCWSQAKSDIKGAVKAGVDVQAYDTVSSLKKAKIMANKQVSATAKGTGSVPASLPTGVDSLTMAQNKAGELLELLNAMPDTLRDAMLDSFIAQADKALQAMKDESLTAETAALEKHIAAA